MKLISQNASYFKMFKKSGPAFYFRTEKRRFSISVIWYFFCLNQITEPRKILQLKLKQKCLIKKQKKYKKKEKINQLDSEFSFLETSTLNFITIQWRKLLLKSLFKEFSSVTYWKKIMKLIKSTYFELKFQVSEFLIIFVASLKTLY